MNLPITPHFITIILFFYSLAVSSLGEELRIKFIAETKVTSSTGGGTVLGGGLAAQIVFSTVFPKIDENKYELVDYNVTVSYVLYVFAYSGSPSLLAQSFYEVNGPGINAFKFNDATFGGGLTLVARKLYDIEELGGIARLICNPDDQQDCSFHFQTAFGAVAGGAIYNIFYLKHPVFEVELVLNKRLQSTDPSVDFPQVNYTTNIFQSSALAPGATIPESELNAFLNDNGFSCLSEPRLKISEGASELRFFAEKDALYRLLGSSDLTTFRLQESLIGNDELVSVPIREKADGLGRFFYLLEKN